MITLSVVMKITALSCKLLCHCFAVKTNYLFFYFLGSLDGRVPTTTDLPSYPYPPLNLTDAAVNENQNVLHNTCNVTNFLYFDFRNLFVVFKVIIKINYSA